VGYFKVAGIMEATHWAIYDGNNNVFIELTGDNDGDKFTKSKIMKRSFKEWVEKWQRRAKVVWKDPVMRRWRASAVYRARKDIGKEPQYAPLPKSNDVSTMNCESFVRTCYMGKRLTRSSQAQLFTDSLHDGETGVTVWGRLATGINSVGNYYQCLVSVRVRVIRVMFVILSSHVFCFGCDHK
jgi:hypothetical protein